jgi:hypothetical protein
VATDPSTKKVRSVALVACGEAPQVTKELVLIHTRREVEIRQVERRGEIAKKIVDCFDSYDGQCPPDVLLGVR